MKMYKIITYVPLEAAEKVRMAMGDAGAGKIGNYSHCTFSMRGFGTFKPLPGAHPHIGEVGKLERVEEERIECDCEAEIVKEVIAAIKKVHPYEEVALDVYQLEVIK